MPSDVQIARNGDLYIADMHHNRVRRVDAATHLITTVAGDGMFGATGDNGPALRASLAGPAGERHAVEWTSTDGLTWSAAAPLTSAGTSEITALTGSGGTATGTAQRGTGPAVLTIPSR